VIALAVILGVTILGLVAVGAMLLQVVRQQGRILLRLEGLEAAGREDGVPVGTPVSFRLADLDGRTIDSADYRGKRLALVNWSPSCGFCDLIAPDLAELHAALRDRGTELLLVSFGDPEENRRLAAEHGLACPIVLQENGALEAFAAVGTPAAYLLDGSGRTTTPLALGAQDVPALLRDAAERGVRLRSPDESRIRRDGLPPGTAAPAFELPSLTGETVRLEDFRGTRVLLVFTDPDCGPCDELLPDLVRIRPAANAAGLDLVLVGRGDVDENRRKRDEHGIDFPFVIQRGWRLSKEYGIFATPVAFLIDEAGVVEREVASGSEAVLALAESALAREEAPMDL
jgi:peroxiredoxin